MIEILFEKVPQDHKLRQKNRMWNLANYVELETLPV